MGKMRSSKMLLTVLLILEFCFTSQAFLSRLIGRTILGDVFPALVEEGLCLGRSTEFATFLHYSRRLPTESQILMTGNWTLLRKSEFDPEIPTKMIIHGFLDNMQLSDWMDKMKTALLFEGNYNVIIVDWSCGNGLPYFKAVENSRIVGNEIADFMTFLKDAVDADPSNFHLIGHSLGSHISAVVGQRIPNLGRITALDPAGPSFYNAPLNRRLDPSDANFVDVIHTDSGESLLEGLGLQQPVGHVDFYPNGGISQPGCYSNPSQIFQFVGIQRAVRHFFTCDHFRAIDIFIDSIRSRGCRYVGVRCKKYSHFTAGQCGDCSEPNRCAVMGFHGDTYPFPNRNVTTKMYFLQTSENQPFCVHQYKVIITAEDVQTSGRRDSSAAPARSLHLQLSRKDGGREKFILDEQKVESLDLANTYVYLIASSDSLDDVTRAKMWWKNKPRLIPLPSDDKVSQNLKVKKIQMVPIDAADRVGRYSGPKIIELCGKTDTTSADIDPVELSGDGC